MRIYRQKAGKGKTYKCGKCGRIINTGEEYQFFQHMHSPKSIRCMQCNPRPSELTTSDKLSLILGAVESLEDALQNAQEPDDLISALEEAITTAETTAEEYRESAQNILEYFSSSAAADECEERADNIDSWKEELEEAKSTLEQLDPRPEEPGEEPIEPEYTEEDEEEEPQPHAEYEKAKEEYEAAIEALEDWETEFENAKSEVENAVSSLSL